MSKILITSGCSFSECFWYTNSAFKRNWPIPLFEYLQTNCGFTDHKSSGLPSQGNGLISRKIFYDVNEALKKYDPKDILVGVMWSGANRHDFRTPDPNLLDFVINKVDNGALENPTSFVKGADKNWAILNINWADSHNKEASTYYRMFHDEIGSAIYSLEHILRIQHYLKSKNISYFFTDYVDHNIVYPTYRYDPELSYLFDNIDRTNYLPVSSMFQWVVDNNIFVDEWDDFRWKEKHTAIVNNKPVSWNTWLHPTNKQHEIFVQRIVLPFLQNKYSALMQK